MTDSNHGILGIDISKLKFDVALMVAGKIKKSHGRKLRVREIEGQVFILLFSTLEN